MSTPTEFAPVLVPFRTAAVYVCPDSLIAAKAAAAAALAETQGAGVAG